MADDNEEIREIIRLLLEGEGCEIIEAANGDEAIEKTGGGVDLIILDIMMPAKNGFKACAEIRGKTNAPIMFLTAKTQDSDKALGFSLGGDGYLSKPFSCAELVSRVKALLRRYCVYRGKSAENEGGMLEIGELRISSEGNRVLAGGREIPLTDLEYRLLLLMAKNRGRIFSAQNLYESVWNEPYYFSSGNTVMAHIKNIRRKIGDDAQNPKTIKTVWGRGYRIERFHTEAFPLAPQPGNFGVFPRSVVRRAGLLFRGGLFFKPDHIRALYRFGGRRRADGALRVQISNKVGESRPEARGTNIGLATCEKIMERHGGALSASRDGDAFRVALSFPVKRGARWGAQE